MYIKINVRGSHNNYIYVNRIDRYICKYACHIILPTHLTEILFSFLLS